MTATMKLNEGTVIFSSYFGSRLYGTNTPESDIDIKGVYVPNKRDLLLRKSPNVINMNTNKSNSKNTKDDIDETYYPLDKFISDLVKGESQAMDLFFACGTDSEIFCSEDYREFHYLLLSNDWLRSKNVKSFVGYCIQQAKKYGVKGSKYGELISIRNMLADFRKNNGKGKFKVSDFIEEGYSVKTEVDSEDNLFVVVLGKKYLNRSPLEKFEQNIDEAIASYGERAKQARDDGNIDYKGISHAFRVIQEVTEFIQTGKITFPLKDKEFVLKVKNKEVSIDECVEQLETRMAELEKLIEESDLPLKANQEEVESAYIELVERILYK